jgi:hypothetical protein
LNDGDLVGNALAWRAMRDQRLCSKFADLDPVGADIGVGPRRRFHVQLNDLDTG